VAPIQHALEKNVVKADRPVLTVAIPTWQRARFLALTLKQLQHEISALPAGTASHVEVLVSDNGSLDETPAVVAQAQLAGLVVRYVRNVENIGSDANIAQCFNLAAGRYVLILGDDDLFVDGALGELLTELAKQEWGVVCMRPYGFEKDFRREHPGGRGRNIDFERVDSFLSAIGPLLTLISSCVVNKGLLQGVDATEFCGSNLVQVHLVVRAILQGRANLLMDRYLIACQRNNSGGYDFSQVFVLNLGQVLDTYRAAGLTDLAIRRFETRMMFSYYPFYLFRQRFARAGDKKATAQRFAQRLGDRWVYRFWLAPILSLPRPLALVWGAMATAFGRAANGDLRRGIVFAWNRVFRS
jgi:abequosyltransferase